jgi:hypothetical protein
MPVESPGFEIETELSIHAVDKRWRIVEVPIDYRDRPEGSESKLNTISDGMAVSRSSRGGPWSTGVFNRPSWAWWRGPPGHRSGPSHRQCAA